MYRYPDENKFAIYGQDKNDMTSPLNIFCNCLSYIWCYLNIIEPLYEMFCCSLSIQMLWNAFDVAWLEIQILIIFTQYFFTLYLRNICIMQINDTDDIILCYTNYIDMKHLYNVLP